VNDIFCIQTEVLNLYLVNERKRHLVLCHPVFGFIIDLFLQGKDLHKWIKNLNQDVLIPNYGYFPIEAFVYYYRKFLYIQRHQLISDQNETELLDERLLNEDIDQGIISTSTIIFETTKKCNLSCKYCSCGQLYCNINQNNKGDLDVNSAIILIDYVLNKKSLLSFKKELAISFYGGEPLLNFHFIKGIVNYVNALMTEVQFKFVIITNGILLNEYMDYLVEKNFTIIISMDGDKKNNDYRVFKDGQSSFKVIYSNIKKLQKDYPDFFNSNIIFKSVLHNKNSVTDIIRFFKESFDKTSEITPLKTNCIKPEKRHEFEEMFVSYEDSVEQSDNILFLEENASSDLPNSKSIFSCIRNYNSFVFSDYIDLIYYKPQKKTPTNTCLPFSKRIFLTVEGRLLPCEKIDYKYSFGKVENNHVKIDYEKLSSFYNDVFDRIRINCYKCSRQNKCPQCFFQLNLDNHEIECNGFINSLNFKEKIKKQIDLIEKYPDKLDKIISNNYNLELI
jgi:uncharacterized protein